jgi:hypothetical protein
MNIEGAKVQGAWSFGGLADAREKVTVRLVVILWTRSLEGRKVP